MVLNLGLSGQPFSGPDIGGYARPGDGTLFARWMGIGALLPFARGHTEKGNPGKEPWSFGPDVERTCRQAIERRYRLLPYIYTLFEAASRTGLPVVRPLFFADPADTTLRRIDDAFLLGADVLVAARVTPDGPRTARLPRDIWRRFHLEVGDEANTDLPELYLRGGSIVPLGPVMQHADERPLDPLQLLVCLDAEGRATGTLYEDEGDGFGWQSGRFRRTSWVAGRDGAAVVVTTQVETGALVPPKREIEVRLLLDGREVRGRAVAGLPVRLE
jgi:alpha-glucosidase